MSEKYSKKETVLLRELAKQTMEIAASEENKKKIQLWTDVNDLHPTRPVTLAYALPWHELNADGDLTLQCENTHLREIEQELRRQLYLHRHMPLDYVIEPCIRSKIMYKDTGYGIRVDEDTRSSDEDNAIVSHHFNNQISSLEDVDKIKDPQITYLKEETEDLLAMNHDIFDGIMEVKPYCFLGYMYGPWDELIRLTGVNEFMDYLYDDPDLLLALAKRYNDASIARMDQFEELGILTQNDDNVLDVAQAGSGGYRYTKHIPRLAPGETVRRKDMWGNSAAQIFTCISPQMFDLLAVSQELKWLDQYALTYYGCCENLSNKMDSLRKIKNLRKISISCWADPRRAAEEIGRDYVYSFKPSVIMLAAETLDEEDVLRHLREYVSAARAENCATEIILKTVSTVRYKPQNLWKFAQLMRQVAEEG